MVLLRGVVMVKVFHQHRSFVDQQMMRLLKVIDTVMDRYTAENVGTSTGPVTGKGEDYYGISPRPQWTGKALSIDLDLPLAGVFGFKLSSSCATQDECFL